MVLSVFLASVSSFKPLWSKKMLDTISIFLNLLRLVLCPLIWSIFENVPCAFEKNVYFASLGWKVLYILIKSIWSNVLFSSTICLLIFCLQDLSIVDSGVLKSPTISVLLSISFLKSKIFFIDLGASMLGAYVYNVYVFLMDSSLEYYQVSFCASFYGLCFESYFVWYK